MAGFDLESLSHLVDHEVQPYQFEPIIASGGRSSQSTSVLQEVQERKGRKDQAVSSWCQCGKCCTMDTDLESLCCREVDKAAQFLTENGCIIEHDFFPQFCLNKWTLHFCSGFHKKILSSPSDYSNDNDRYRYTAYRNFVYAVWNRLPRNKRKVIPSCVVMAIRRAYPDLSEKYTGFQIVTE